MCASSFLFKKLDSYNPNESKRLKKWFDQQKFKKSKLILVPVHKNGNHWVLGAIKMEEKVIAFYDNENGRPIPSFFEKMRKLLYTSDIDLHGWREEWPKCPQQTDSSSCEVFAIENAKRLVHGRPVNYTQEDAEDLRHDVAMSLLAYSCKSRKSKSL